MTTVTVCFAHGTQILSDKGEVAIENLRIDDQVIVSDGSARPIKWLGHGFVDCRRHADPYTVWPVCITAHAFGVGKPARDLFVSPGHSICVTCVDEVLIHASALINGATIFQVKTETITYWHLELDRHDIVIANGLPAESYLEMSNRSFFVEHQIVALDAQPDIAVRTTADFCRPFISDGPVLEAVRQRLAARAIELGGKSSRPELEVLAANS